MKKIIFFELESKMTEQLNSCKSCGFQVTTLLCGIAIGATGAYILTRVRYVSNSFWFNFFARRPHVEVNLFSTKYEQKGVCLLNFIITYNFLKKFAEREQHLWPMDALGFQKGMSKITDLIVNYIQNTENYKVLTGEHIFAYL